MRLVGASGMNAFSGCTYFGRLIKRNTEALGSHGRGSWFAAIITKENIGYVIHV